jgi:hypothetical protein
MSIKISEHQIQNFGKVSYVKIVPTGNVIVLAGMNAAGKSTCLNSIQTNFTKFSSREIPHPIKHGHAKAANETIMTDGSILKRTFTPSGGAALVIKGPDGQKISQEKFAEKVSSLGVDASRFPLLGEKEQLKALLSVVDLPFAPEELEAERKEIFDERTGVNRDIKQLEAQHAAFLPLPANLPEDEVSVTDLLAEHRAAQELERAQAEDLKERARANAEIHRINAEIGRLIQLRTAAEEDASNVDARIAAHAPLPDLDDIQLSIDNAEVTNAQIRAAKEKRAVGARLLEAVQAAGTLTAQLEEIDQRKADALAAAADQLPVEGLSFDEEGVLFQGVPFTLASTAEKIIVSVAMIIATDPEVRVALVRSGESLDMNSLQIIHQMAEDNDFQIFIEIAANEAGDHEYYFVDGELAA